VVKDLVRLRGNFRVLFLYDVAEAFDLEKLQSLLGANCGPMQQPFPRRTPQYVRFEKPPIVQSLDPIPLGPTSAGGGATAACSVKYYSFGVLVVHVAVPFDCDWPALLAQSSRWVVADEIEKQVREMAHRQMDRIAAAVTRPNQDWLRESYLVTEINEILGESGEHPTSQELRASHGGELVQLVRGETTPLSAKAVEEALQASLSYYPDDLVVISFYGSVVVDRPEDAAAVTQVLEYAKMQLLEFRYYDRLMTQVLAEIYAALDRKRNILLSRWTLPRDANRFNRIRVDVIELTEHIDNAIKFVSDIYYAHVYRLAATRIGVQDYRTLVDEKLQTADDLTDFMLEQFNEYRSFVLEVIVTLLTILDLLLIFRGK
jgi:hypothetical protein